MARSQWFGHEVTEPVRLHAAVEAVPVHDGAGVLRAERASSV